VEEMRMKEEQRESGNDRRYGKKEERRTNKE